MWWRNDSLARRLRIVAALAVAATTAGCFQPLYGEHTIGSGASLHDVMSSVEVPEITIGSPSTDGHLGVELRNELIFATSGGGYPASPAYRLNISVSSTRQSVVVDPATARPELENFGINATYQLVDLATKKIVITDQTFSRVSYDIPGQQQRFAKQRAIRDAESRALGVIADQIKSRIASYFVAGT